MYLCQHPLTYGRRSGVYTNTTLSDPPHIPRPSNVLYSLFIFSRLAVLDYLIHIYSKIITKLSWKNLVSIFILKYVFLPYLYGMVYILICLFFK